MINLLIDAINKKIPANRALSDFMKALKEKKQALEVTGPQGFFLSIILAKVIKQSGPCLVVLPTDQEVQVLANDLELLGIESEIFPHWGTLLYQGVSAQASIFGQRARVLQRTAAGKTPLILLSLRSLLSYLPPKSVIAPMVMNFQIGNPLRAKDVLEKLSRFGYTRVSTVSVHGEFALRGEVLDVFPPGEDNAYRIVFEYDVIEEIRSFDADSQMSLEKLNLVQVPLVKEVLWDEDNLNRLEKYFLSKKNGQEDWETFSGEIEKQGFFRGEELFYPLAYPERQTWEDYLGPEGRILYLEWDRLAATAKGLENEWRTLYTGALQNGLIVPRPTEIFRLPQELMDGQFKGIRFNQLRREKEEGISSFTIPCDPPRSFLGNINLFKEEVQVLLDQGWSIFIVADSGSQVQRITYLLNDDRLKVLKGNISQGFGLGKEKILVLQENQIFGRKKRVQTTLKKVQTKIIDSFVELNPGDYVVHLNYGIGRFKGIDRIKAGGNERDYIQLEYSDGETVFIPIEQVNLVQKYIGGEGKKPKLDVIGGKSWEKKKNKVSKAVEDLADRLVLLYAKRREAVGFSFPKDNDWQMSFEAAFPYQETEDQFTAIEEVKLDMEAPRPMDRLICGDVGYGKTEIAMRAAFKAVMGGKQVAFLAPTTILVEQHFENFLERFERFPVSIGMLSRFRTKAEQKQALKNLAEGKIDIIVGTHRLLSKDVKFKNLGLLMVDEEQRFGVKDKERLKELRASIDALTLSATPIPRTLHMSLLKIRDMSVLKTAPYNRHPVETFIQEFDEKLIASAIKREVERGGQVFFLHNRVETLEQIQMFLRKLLPDMFIEIAHGKMQPKELEDIMHRFIHGGFQVLVSTTIIENGIDIPNVNTIIIDRADMYGISQLYQLRGRVGRSGRLAYAYLFYPQDRALTELAMKRLRVINDFTELGSGFKIAMKDLEVRGAGNLLGAEQSGNIMSVGFDMYLRMLDEAVAQRQDEPREEYQEIILELEYSGFIPDEYIAEATEKMEIYKRIASVTTAEELAALNQEIYDRFGPLPEEVHSLLSLSEIKIVCRKLKIGSLRERKGLCRVEFLKMKDLPFDKAMRLIKESAGKVKSLPNAPNMLIIDTGRVGLREKSAFICDRLSALLP
jgi:transcription-repair coupling factor (superfamily II helicase)